MIKKSMKQKAYIGIRVNMSQKFFYLISNSRPEGVMTNGPYPTLFEAEKAAYRLTKHSRLFIRLVYSYSKEIIMNSLFYVCNFKHGVRV
jgi:hypothetical protein